MSKRTLTTFAAAGLLALAPAFAQSQGTTSGGSHDTHGSHGSTAQGTATGQGTTGQSQEMGRVTRPSQDPNEMNTQDEKFFREAASGGLLEVELGRLAAERATSAEVKAFGQRMVTDHGKANQQLLQIAAAKRKEAPKDLLPQHKQHRDQLSRLSGAEFERMYLQHMVQEHKKDVSSFEQQVQKGTDPALRSFAQETLPTLREHLSMVQTLASSKGASNSGQKK